MYYYDHVDQIVVDIYICIMRIYGNEYICTVNVYEYKNIFEYEFENKNIEKKLNIKMWAWN